MASITWAQVALKIGLAVFCMWLSMVIHELGHFVVMKSLGYKVVEISFGKRQDPMLRIPVGGANVYFTPYIWAGVTTFHTDKPTIKIKTYAAFLVAGSFTNLLVILAVFLFRGSQDFVSIKNLFTFQGLPTFLGFFIVMNLAYGIGELMPVWSGDGRRLLKLWQGKYSELD